MKILLWAGIDCSRQGSFEDYLTAMGGAAHGRGQQLQLSLLGVSSQGVCERFAQNELQWQIHPLELHAQSRAFQATLGQFKPDLVHFHFIGPCSPLVAIAARRGVRCVMTDHSSEPEPVLHSPLLRQLRMWRRRRFGRMVDLHLGVSEFVCRRLRANQSGLNIECLHNGIDLQRFSTHPQPIDHDLQARIRGRFTLGFVGQLSQTKGLDFALALMQQLDPERFCLLVIGDGPLRDTLPAHQEGLIVLGQREDLPHLMPQLQLLLVPSRWNEAFGFVVAEAAACAVPSLTHAVGGLPEVVEHGVSGFVMPDIEPEAWLTKIRELAADPQCCHRLGQAARLNVEKRFNLSSQVERTWQHYERLLQA